MAKLFELTQDRAVLTADIRAMMDKHEGAEMNAEDKGILNKMENDFDALNARIASEQKTT